jgi:hypothetical protein
MAAPIQRYKIALDTAEEQAQRHRGSRGESVLTMSDVTIGVNTKGEVTIVLATGRRNIYNMLLVECAKRQPSKLNAQAPGPSRAGEITYSL